jgi:L-threonylcarbamoyladenylate synthase
MILPADPASIHRAAVLLRDGQVVAIPTETVYGLACRIDRPEAIKRVFELKGRPADNPLIVHVSSVGHARELCDPADHPLLERLAAAFWPGPLTLVLRRSEAVSDQVTAGLDTVALRMPSHPVALEILRQSACPLAAPSANVSGRPSPTRAEHVREDFGDNVTVIDAGACEHGLESTVVRVIGGQCLILRQGAIQMQALQTVLTEMFVRNAGDSDQAHRSPGTRYRHYAPKADVVLCGTVKDVQDELLNSKEQNSIVLASPASAEAHPELHARILTPATLFNEFRRADGLQVDRIVVLCDADLASQEALMSRLRKAAQNDDHSYE